MPSVLAIISKAVFEKMVPKSVKLGDVVSTNHYLSRVKALDALKGGGALFLVTVRPPDERLWLAAILEAPVFKSDGWYAKGNTTPIADVTAAIPKLVFASGVGLKAKKGALGMSLQTPRVLTDDDEKLLRGFAKGGKSKATPKDAYAAAVKATPTAKAAAAYAGGMAKEGGLRPLRFENHRRRNTWAAFTAGEKKQLKAFEAGFQEQEEWGGFQLIDVRDLSQGSAGKVVFLFAVWPFGSAVLLKAGKPDVLGDAAQHGFALRKPDPLLRKSLAAAYAEARGTMGDLEGIMFGPTKAELGAAPASTASGDALFKAVDKLKWNQVEQEHASAIGALLKLWGKDSKATETLRALLTNDKAVGRKPICGSVTGLVLSAISTKKFDRAAQLTPEQREVLGVIAGHPKALRFGLSGSNGKHPWPGTALELGRWLGTKPPPFLDRKLKSGETIVEAVTAAVHGTGPLEKVAKRIASAVERERVVDLLDDLFGTSHTFTNVSDIEIDHRKLSPEGKAMRDLEIARRMARLFELGRALMAESLDLTSVQAELQAGGHLKKPAACLLLAADALAVGKKPELPDGFAEELAEVAAYADFAEPVRRLLGQCSDRERGRFLAQLQCDVDSDNPSAWLYVDLLSPREADSIAKSYNLLPNEELTPQLLKRVSKADGVRILGVVAKQYGAKVEQRADQRARVVEFSVPGGTPVALWASPARGTLVDRAPWKP